MDEEESSIPLAAAPQVQYFDVSDVESTDTEPEAGVELEDDDGELEVFDNDEQGGDASEVIGISSIPPAGADPFGMAQLAAQQPAPPRPAPQPLIFFDGVGIEGGSSKQQGIADAHQLVHRILVLT